MSLNTDVIEDSPVTDTHDRLGELIQQADRNPLAPTIENVFALALDTNEKVTEIRDILRDLNEKVEAGAAAIPEIADKLGNVPIIGGAIRALLNPSD
jgi:ABC-type transporter Mla subunit MlaD